MLRSTSSSPRISTSYSGRRIYPAINISNDSHDNSLSSRCKTAVVAEVEKMVGLETEDHSESVKYDHIKEDILPLHNFNDMDLTATVNIDEENFDDQLE
jgi:hypothetical protein